MFDRPVSIALLLLAAAGGAHACGPNGDVPNGGDAAADPPSPVIFLDYEGGYRPAGHDRGDSALQVFADGTVLLGSSGGLLRPMRAHLPPERLDALLHEIVDELRFPAIDGAALERKLRDAAAAQGRLPGPLADAPLTILRVVSERGPHEVRFAGLAERALRHPEIAELQRLERVRWRLERLRGEAYAGGPEGVRQWLALANRELAAGHPEVAPLGEADFESAARYTTGRAVVTFSRPPDAGAGGPRVLVRIDAPADGRPEVEILVGEGD